MFYRQKKKYIKGCGAVANTNNNNNSRRRRSVESFTFKSQPLNMGQNKRRRASTRTRGERAEAAPAASPERPTMPQQRPASARRRGRGRPSARAGQTANVRMVSEAQESPVTRGRGRPPGRRRGTPKGGSHERPRQGRMRRRAPVVNLDGVSSSESEVEQKRKRTQKKTKKQEVENKEQLHITLSPDKMCRGIMSDSSDSEEDQKSSPAATPPRTPVVCRPLPALDEGDSPSTGSDDDIFDVDYSACNLHALQSAFKEIKSTETPKTPPPLSHLTRKTTTRAKPVAASDNDDILVVQEYPAHSNERESIDDVSRNARPSSPVLFAIDSPVQSPQKRANTSTEPQSKSGISRRELPMSLSESLNISSDIILSEGEEEEEVNPEIRVRIKWGNDYFREPIKKHPNQPPPPPPSQW
ncbi:serine/arginine repetitive matrix protein 1-like isoform X3 [Eriocheir sinensis]|uniref:serine/arginine repetitive matrix protein 1-like isoform X3 n=1 Tax=Eriocheir sinensis TaxID=95602 RepID=UPI0021C6F4D3|nr:serine/arginine repetitive matrix protein 1-like isoform X3 [Eriocheir sinensis]